MKKFLFTNIFILGLSASSVMADHWGKPKNLSSNGPWNENLSAIIKDSDKLRLEKPKQTIVKQAGVSNIVDFEGTPRVYFQWLTTDKEKIRNFDHIAFIDYKDQIWSEPKVVKFSASNDSKILNKPEKYPVDPTVVRTSEGKYRMYFTTHSKKGTYIASAVSDDGEYFNIEPGKRFRKKGFDIKDCAVVFFNDLWHMITPSHRNDGIGYYSYSTDGLLFVRGDDLKIDSKGDWLGNFFIKNEKVYFLGTRFVASTKDFKNWQKEFNHKLNDPSMFVIGEKNIQISTTR